MPHIFTVKHETAIHRGGVGGEGKGKLPARSLKLKTMKQRSITHISHESTSQAPTTNVIRWLIFIIYNTSCRATPAPPGDANPEEEGRQTLFYETSHLSHMIYYT